MPSKQNSVADGEYVSKRQRRRPTTPRTKGQVRENTARVASTVGYILHGVVLAEARAGQQDNLHAQPARDNSPGWWGGSTLPLHGDTKASNTP